MVKENASCHSASRGTVQLPLPPPLRPLPPSAKQDFVFCIHFQLVTSKNLLFNVASYKSHLQLCSYQKGIARARYSNSKRLWFHCMQLATHRSAGTTMETSTLLLGRHILHGMVANRSSMQNARGQPIARSDHVCTCPHSSTTTRPRTRTVSVGRS